MNNHHPLDSVVGTILELYAMENEYGLKTGDEFFSGYWPEMSGEQVHQLLGARSICKAAINHPMRHYFTGGFGWFSPY